MTEIGPKLSRLYREASSETPPAALDAAILAAARKRVAKPQRPPRSPWLRWMAPASAIATLVLGVSIALLVEREQPATDADTMINRIPPQPQTPPPARAAESAKPKAADRAAPDAAAKKEAPAATAPILAPAATAPVLAPAANLPAPSPSGTLPALAPTAPAQTPAPPSAAPAPPAAEAFPAESRAKTSAPSAAAPRAATESNAASDSARGGLGAGAPAAPAASSTAPAAAGKLAPLRKQAQQLSPEAWLDEIGRLKREGRDKEAAEQLAEFRKTYPAYALPATLMK